MIIEFTNGNQARDFMGHCQEFNNQGFKCVLCDYASNIDDFQQYDEYQNDCAVWFNVIEDCYDDEDGTLRDHLIEYAESLLN